MVDYSFAKIYKIVDNTTGNYYIGSTCEPILARRLAGHISGHKSFLSGKRNKYCTSFEILKNNDYGIILIEKCENIFSRDELRARERFYIESCECVNKNLPGRTKKEYYQSTIEKHQQYYQSHKAKLQEQSRNYRRKGNGKVSDRKYYQEHIEKRQQYYQANREKLNEYAKQYKQDNKEILQEKASSLIECSICNCKITRHHKSEHNKTRKHLLAVQTKTASEDKDKTVCKESVLI